MQKITDASLANKILDALEKSARPWDYVERGDGKDFSVIIIDGHFDLIAVAKNLQNELKIEQL